MDEEQLRILIAANETASGPLGTVTSGATLLKTELTELHAIMQKYGTKASYAGFDRGMKAMEARMVSMGAKTESLRQQYISLNRTVSSSGGVALRAAEKHAESANIIRGAARGVPTYSPSGGKMDPKGIKPPTGPLKDYNSTVKKNIDLTKKQGRVFSFAARELYGLRLGFLGSIFSAGIFARFIGGIIVNTVTLGEEIRNLKTAFNITFEKEMVKSNEQLYKMRRASKGLISDMELMRTAVFVAQFPFAHLKNLLPEIIEASTTLALAQGKDIPQAVDDMVRALGRGSSKILDNLGIILKTEQAHAAYAKQLGKTVKQLTEKEKAEAFSIIGTQMLIEKAKTYVGLNKEIQSSLVAIENEWHNLSSTSASADVIVASLKAVLHVIEEIVKGIRSLIIYVDIVSTVTIGLVRVLDKMTSFGDNPFGFADESAFKKLIDANNKYRESLDETLIRHGLLSKADVPDIFLGSKIGGKDSSVQEESPDEKVLREKKEAKNQRFQNIISDAQHAQQLRDLENYDMASKYLSENKKPDFRPIEEAKKKKGYDKDETSLEDFSKSVRESEKEFRDLSELFRTSTATVENENKKREIATKKSDDLDVKILRFKNDILELERSYNSDRKNELLSKDLDAARSFVKEHEFRESQGEFNKTPIQIATERAEGRISEADTSEEEIAALNFLKKELNREIDIRQEHLDDLSTSHKTILRSETDQAKALAKVKNEDLASQSWYFSERQDIERQIVQEEENAFRSLAQGANDLAKVFGDSAVVMVSAGTSVIEQIRLFDDFSKIGGTTGALGQAGTSATIASMIPEITLAIARSLESPAEKMDRAANKMLQASSEFSQDFLSQDPDYQKLKTSLIAPIIGEAVKLLQANDGDRFLAISKFLTEGIRYGRRNTKISDSLNDPQDPGANQFRKFGINPNPFKELYGQQTGSDGKETEIYGENIQKQLKAVFGPNATFADLQKEAIRLSDAFKILVDQSDDLSEAGEQQIKDDKDLERARLRGIAASKIRDSGDDFVKRREIVEQLRLDLSQIRGQEESAINYNRVPGVRTPLVDDDGGNANTPTYPGLPTYPTLPEIPVDVEPKIEPNAGMEFIDKILKSLKETVDKSLGFINPIILAVDSLISLEPKSGRSFAGEQDGDNIDGEVSASLVFLEKLRNELQTGLDSITPVSVKIGDLIENKGDGTDILKTIDDLRKGLEDGLKSFEPALTTLDTLIRIDEPDSNFTGILTGLRTSLTLGLGLFEPISIAMDNLIKTDSDGLGVDNILTDLHTQLSEKILEFSPVIIGLAELMSTDTDESSRNIISDLRKGLMSSVSEFNPVISNIQALLFVSYEGLSSTFSSLISSSLTSGIGGVGSQTFDLSKTISVTGGDLGEQIGDVIDQAVSSALSNSRSGNPDTFEDTYGYEEPAPRDYIDQLHAELGTQGYRGEGPPRYNNPQDNRGYRYNNPQANRGY